MAATEPPPPLSAQERAVPVAWFAIAVVVAIVIAGIATALVLSRPASTAPTQSFPGVGRVLVNAQGVAANGDYSVEFNITSSSNPTVRSPVGAIVLINLTCQGPSVQNGPFCDYFLFACPCNVQHVNYTWPEVPIIGTFATNTTALDPGEYQFGVGAVSGHGPTAVLPVRMTVSVELLEFA